jgi:hypothetical protein
MKQNPLTVASIRSTAKQNKRANSNILETSGKIKSRHVRESKPEVPWYMKMPVNDLRLN